MFQSAHRYLPSAATQAATQAAARVQAAAERGKTLAERGKGLLAEHVETSRSLLAEHVEHGRELAAQGAAYASTFRYEKPDTTVWALAGTTFNLLNGTTGPGLLALPLAFARCGWLLGTIILVFVFALNHVALLFLLKACLATREHSYIGLSMRAGPTVAALVDWASLAFFFGSSVSYLVIIGDSFGQVTSRLGDGPLYRGGELMHFSVYALLALVLFTAAVLAPLSMLRSMDSLAFTSGIAMACIIYTVFIIVVTPQAAVTTASAAAIATASISGSSAIEGPTQIASALSDGLDEPTEPWTMQVPLTTPAALFTAQSLLSLPTMTFCFASQSLFPPALETLHQPATYEHMGAVVNVTMGLTLLLHLLVALAGCLRFGGAVSANVLDSLPSSFAVNAARLAIVMAFAFTFPMMIFLCRMHIQSILARLILTRQQADTDEASSETAPAEERHTLITSALVGGALLTAVLFPNIDALFGLLGGTTAVVISFVAPAIFWEQFVGNMYKWSHPRKIFCRVLIGFSVLVAGLSLPGVLVDVIGDLYATAWWVPMATVGQGMSTWPGGLALEIPAADASELHGLGHS
mmetsp:Transcript_45407/g.119242  ORF Transcript_45407/g.119242 Transcript_45407/m.119242 type:complete len:581 (+) Transcript_45407:73-1815(+)|eukprot:CAMPEP_0115871422 /NCGR_PEP_ID=MMETSP0287-20121206/22863_1 /TAXON_ID=412157 /ORGANISM="Chrysochromulina rotalis, Strain UIO044" /LENGTH=580 /DNA_ID=CAMNT_0003326233 /DNA_START=1 /DNA_END=1743 /DNA_ORIENTATION=-